MTSSTENGNALEGVPTETGQLHHLPMASGSRMLEKLGLPRNPYVDRTAEKTMLKSGAYYLHSDLQGFSPSETTYIFFGRRGSGKTTIRLMMMHRYEQYNEARLREGKAPCFVVDLCRPGHMDDCLKTYMHAIGADMDNWDAMFQDAWKSTDLADCIVAFAINDMMREVAHDTDQGKQILSCLSKDRRSAAQFLLLSHLYTREDSATLAKLRAKLLPSKLSARFLLKSAIGISAIVGLGLGIYYGFGLNEPPASSSSSSSLAGLYTTATSHPKVAFSGFALSSGIVGFVMQRSMKSKNRRRAEELSFPVKIAKARVDLVETLLGKIASPDDSAETVRRLHVGHSAQQKLELLQQLCRSCGYSAVAVFGDCFDEVGMLDPLLYPTALKVFAREVCRNEILNQGRLHFFFPDARASLDLSTDRVVREARFDRHFVRDLTWSRFQLQDLAERRFLADGLLHSMDKISLNESKSTAQLLIYLAQSEAGVTNGKLTKFSSLFEHVSREDFSGAISKLGTPRELMVFMTELLARLEAHSEDNSMVAAQDMEIAVQKAQDQSV